MKNTNRFALVMSLFILTAGCTTASAQTATYPEVISLIRVHLQSGNEFSVRQSLAISVDNQAFQGFPYINVYAIAEYASGEDSGLPWGPCLRFRYHIWHWRNRGSGDMNFGEIKEQDLWWLDSDLNTGGSKAKVRLFFEPGVPGSESWEENFLFVVNERQLIQKFWDSGVSILINHTPRAASPRPWLLGSLISFFSPPVVQAAPPPPPPGSLVPPPGFNGHCISKIEEVGDGNTLLREVPCGDPPSVIPAPPLPGLALRALSH